MKYSFKTKISEHIIEDNIGQLICLDVPLARDGSYEYTSDEVFRDGKYDTVTLYRDWEDVRKLALTLEGKPTVVSHNGGVDINLNNIDEYKVGHAQNIREDKAEFEGKTYNILIGDLFFDDPETIELIKSRELREISLGYFYDIDDSDPNRLRQVNMIAEHIALVRSGRAGIAKILDAASEFGMIKVNTNGEQSFLDFTEELKRPHPSWNALKDNRGYYRFNNRLTADSMSTVPMSIAEEIAKRHRTGAFVILTDKLIPAKYYLFGKESNKTELIKADFDFDLRLETLDSYDIPDEVDFRETLETESDKVQRDTEAALAVEGVKINQLLAILDKDFRTRGDNYRGANWTKLVYSLRRIQPLVESVLKTGLPTDRYDGRYLRIAEAFTAEARKAIRKANDEINIQLLVVAFDAEKSVIEIVGSVEHAVQFFKQHSKRVKFNASIDDFIEETNNVTGAYVMLSMDWNLVAAVSRSIDEDNVEIITAESLEELNKDLAEYFTSVDEAVMIINGGGEKYKKMSAVLLYA